MVSRQLSVLSSFRSREEAKGAMKKILTLGIGQDAVQVAALAGDESANSRDASVLRAADPVNSGMADGKGMVTGYNWLLTVIAPENLVERVVRIVKENGGFT
jgi:hypothetical protein